jgi:hypothetical protein
MTAADETRLPPAGALLWGTLRRRWVTLAAVVVAALGLVAVSFSRIGQNLVYYWGPTELQAAGDKAGRRDHPPRRAGRRRLGEARARRLRRRVRRRSTARAP